MVINRSDSLPGRWLNDGTLGAFHNTRTEKEKESQTETLHVSKLLPNSKICHLCGVQVSVLGDKTPPSHVILLKQGFYLIIYLMLVN